VDEGGDLDDFWPVAVAILLLALVVVALAGFFTLGRTFLAFSAVLIVTMVMVGVWAVVAGKRTGESPVHAFGRGCREGVICFVSLLP
jgi:hypothetical protein